MSFIQLDLFGAQHLVYAVKRSPYSNRGQARGLLIRSKHHFLHEGAEPFKFLMD